MQKSLEIEWKEFAEFCSLKSKNRAHINNLVNYAKKYHELIFLNPLKFALKFKEISQQKKSLKRHILQALAAFAKYLDLKYNTNEYYEKFKELRSKAGISWAEEKVPQFLVNEISKEKILEIIKSIEEERLKATSLLHLLTGLRTSEVFYLVKNFDRLKKSENEKGFIVELAYLRKTKKVFVTFLHRDATNLIKKAFRSKRSYWKNLKKYGLKPYDFRRIFESVYSNLRSHEVDLLQGRLSTELTIHYTRDISSIAERIFSTQEKILKSII
ncbi:MAG: integrase [Candidatus Aenigmatarchaeota archaeon]